MSYRNPQTVVDTESAKYYAQAISGIGQMSAQVITNFNKEQRDIAKANKKQNLLNTANETKYNSVWLEKVNKGLTGKPIDLSNDLRGLLTPMIDKAAKINTELKNFSANPGESNEQYSARKTGLQKELNSLETLFSSGTKNALENLVKRQNDQSEFGKCIGQEGCQSASATQPELQVDIASTMAGTPNKEYNLGLIEMEDGSYNFDLGFAGADPSEARSYNLNKDLGEEALILNPNITKPFIKALEDLQILKKGAPNIESQSLMGMVDGVTTLTVGSKKFEIGKIDYKLFTDKVSDPLQGIVGGIVSMGNQADGNSGTGLATMQSWVDDILPDTPFPDKVNGDGKPISYDDYVGTLDLDPTTVHGLTKESYDKLQEAIVYQKYVTIQNGMERVEIKTNDSDGGSKITGNKQLELVTTQERLDNLVVMFDKLDPKRGFSKIGNKRKDITFNSEFQREINRFGFSFSKPPNENEESEFVILKADKTAKTKEVPSKGLSDLELKQQMYLLDGGKLTDTAYKKLEGPAAKENPWNVFKR